MTMIDLDRLRELAAESERGAMPRTSQFPSMTDQLLRQRHEIHALRRGLSEAVAEIESLRRKTSGDQRDRLKLALDAAEEASRLIPVQKSTNPSGYGGFVPDIAVAIPVPVWEDLLVAIDYLPETME